MHRLGRNHPRPSHRTKVIAGITVTAGALAALVVVTSAESGSRHSPEVAAAAARARPVTSWAAQPPGSTVDQAKAEVPLHHLIARAIAAADRRRDAREAAERRADQRAVAPPVSSPVPTVQPTVPATTGAGAYSFAALENLWTSAGGPGWAASQAASIAMCESGGNPQAYNPSGASGLWQILGQVVPGDIFDPLVNAENAVAKFSASGDTFAQWVC